MDPGSNIIRLLHPQLKFSKFGVDCGAIGIKNIIRPLSENPLRLELCHKPIDNALYLNLKFDPDLVRTNIVTPPPQKPH